MAGQQPSYSINQYHAKRMRFSKMQLHVVSHFYTAGLYKPLPKLYIYKNSAVYLSDARVTFFARFENLTKIELQSVQFA